MKTTKQYLQELEDQLCDKIAHDWEEDERFETKREMQKYNCGVADAMKLVREIMETDDFKNPLLKQIEQ